MLWLRSLAPGLWTEVISVGMERLAADPFAFARRDWEYFSFLVRRITHRPR